MINLGNSEEGILVEHANLRKGLLHKIPEHEENKA